MILDFLLGFLTGLLMATILLIIHLNKQEKEIMKKYSKKK